MPGITAGIIRVREGLMWGNTVFTPSYVKKHYNAWANIICSWFETVLDYELGILGAKIEEFPFLIHKLSVTLFCSTI